MICSVLVLIAITLRIHFTIICNGAKGITRIIMGPRMNTQFIHFHDLHPTVEDRNQAS